MSKVCKLTSKRRNVGYNVSHAHNKTKKVQHPNLQSKRVWSDSQQRLVRIRMSTRALRSVTKKGLDRYLKENGLTLRDVQ
ncbi:MAG: 50S ribosomal protein L28 [Myxococcales bacterium]|nr:50S ribosomal protein L28 [Myxococcales bacterium]